MILLYSLSFSSFVQRHEDLLIVIEEDYGYAALFKFSYRISYLEKLDNMFNETVFFFKLTNLTSIKSNTKIIL